MLGINPRKVHFIDLQILFPLLISAVAVWKTIPRHRLHWQQTLLCKYNLTHVWLSWFKTRTLRRENIWLRLAFTFYPQLSQKTWSQVEPKQTALPGCKGHSPPSHPFRLTGSRSQSSIFSSLSSWHLLQIGISMGSPRAAHISIPTWWFGLSLLDVDKGRQKVATGPSLGQLSISFG